MVWKICSDKIVNKFLTCTVAKVGINSKTLIKKMIIRNANQDDQAATWQIISEVISKGDTYVFAPDSSKEKMLSYWFSDDKKTYIAEEDGKILGTFYLKTNQMDLGSHIVNAGYMVSSEARGKGLGQTMAEFSMEEARRLGYKAMQFNLVVKTNENAVKLWLKMGFAIIGEIPEAYQHSRLGLVNAYIMYQKL
jgi:ribosomal protein S18 acetylase RimI-like enzyme